MGGGLAWEGGGGLGGDSVNKSPTCWKNIGDSIKSSGKCFPKKAGIAAASGEKFSKESRYSNSSRREIFANSCFSSYQCCRSGSCWRRSRFPQSNQKKCRSGSSSWQKSRFPQSNKKCCRFGSSCWRNPDFHSQIRNNVDPDHVDANPDFFSQIKKVLLIRIMCLICAAGVIHWQREYGEPGTAHP